MKKYVYTGPVSSIYINGNAIGLTDGAELELPEDHQHVVVLVHRKHLIEVKAKAEKPEKPEKPSKAPKSSSKPPKSSKAPKSSRAPKAAPLAPSTEDPPVLEGAKKGGR